MQIKRIPKGYVVRLDSGEELFASLSAFADERKIEAASISGIGTVSEIDLSYHNEASLNLETKTIQGRMEVLSLSGTITISDDEPFFHVHGVFGKDDFSTIGGHLQRAVAQVTMELFIIDFETQVRRDAMTGVLRLDPTEN